MQDEINEKVVALSVKGAKLTAEMLQKAIKAMLAQAKKQQEKQPHGKQTLKQLAKQNAGLSNIEITEGNIKAFEQTAKKYGIDFALKKDSTETPLRQNLISIAATEDGQPRIDILDGAGICCGLCWFSFGVGFWSSRLFVSCG